MGKKLYVGNLSFNVDSESLGQLFGSKGTVESSRVITDRDSGRSKGFGFIEMSSSEEANACIEHFHGYEYEGREMNVTEARPQEPRNNFGGGGGGGGGGSRGGYGGGGGGGGKRY